MTPAKYSFGGLVAFATIQFSVLLVGSFLGAVCAQEMVLQTVDGQQLKGVVQRIDQSKQVIGPGLGNDLKLDSILSIQTNRPARAVSQPMQVYLVGETAWGIAKIGAIEVSITEEKVSLAGRLGKFELPLESVRAIVWRDSKTVQQAISKPSADNDRVIVNVDGKSQTVTGIIEGVTKEAVRIDYKGKVRSIGIEKVNAIVLANVGYQAPTGVLASVSIVDGSRFFGGIQSWGNDLNGSNGAVVELSIARGTTLSIPTAQVAEVQVQSDRVLFLSKVEPVAVTETTDFVEPRSFQRDRSVTGGKLQIRGADDQPITFSNGIGAQATSELTYTNDKKFNRLLATVGIDLGTKGRGDCQVVVKTDGVEVFNQRITGSSDPLELDVDVASANRVSLIVLPGREFDLADHVVWGNAKLINTKDSK